MATKNGLKILKVGIIVAIIGVFAALFVPAFFLENKKNNYAVINSEYAILTDSVTIGGENSFEQGIKEIFEFFTTGQDAKLPNQKGEITLCLDELVDVLESRKSVNSAALKGLATIKAQGEAITILYKESEERPVASISYKAVNGNYDVTIMADSLIIDGEAYDDEDAKNLD